MIRLSGWRGGGLALALWLLFLVLLCLHLQSGPPGGHGSDEDNWMGFTDREARLASRLHESESKNRWLQLQLSLSQEKANKGLVRKEPVEGQDCNLIPGPCQPVHVAIVCAGINASRTVVTLLKSILFYRRNPIYFHFISDIIARRTLTHLASTWRLPQVQWRFYNAEDVVDDVSWIPNKHYSGVYGLLKLTLPKILPSSLDKVIILDTDVTFATDIGKLWALFQNFNMGQALGLVENQSDWYIPGKLWKNHRPWPALGRGLNTGVILMDLNRLRKDNWSKTWRIVAETDLVTMFSTSLADQDIFNAVLRRQSELLYRLPCQWNVQLSDNSLSDTLCYTKHKNQPVYVIHFNTPKKIYSDNKHINYFRNMHLTFLQYDGNLLRRELYHCREETEDQEIDENVSEKDPCSGFRSSGNILYRSHIYFLPYCDINNNNNKNKNKNNNNNNNNNGTGMTTLVAQLSMDRVHMLVPLLEKWDGPVSLSLYLTDPEADQFVDLYQNNPILTSRCNVGYHVVYKEGNFYPINLLRNLALDHVSTDYVFLSDIDFLPSQGIVSSLIMSTNNLLKDHPKRALVIPALESQRYKLNQFPTSKAEVVKRLDLGELFTFRQHDWAQGHEATNFVRWRTSTQPYSVRWKTNYEPYVVVSKDVVRYDTRFVGFGWNKVSHMLALFAEKYELVVLPDVFIIHIPHAPSMEIMRYRGDLHYRACLDTLKKEFQKELEAKWGEKEKKTI